MSPRREKEVQNCRAGRSAFASLYLAFLSLLPGLSGCRTVSPAGPIDLSLPGWTVRQGQAVWTAARGAEGVAGELLVATQPDGSSWVQFSKPPFNLFTAQRQANHWHIECQQGRKQYGGGGAPPSRFIWFQLAKAAAGQPPERGWKFTREPDGGWILIQLKTGEQLEGYLAP